MTAFHESFDRIGYPYYFKLLPTERIQEGQRGGKDESYAEVT
jgi:hypothetical protein